MGPCCLPSEILNLLHRSTWPFDRYRHGCDPPERRLWFKVLHPTFNCNHRPLACPFNFSPRSFVSQVLFRVEPFINPVRHTGTTQGPLGKLYGRDAGFVQKKLEEKKPHTSTQVRRMICHFEKYLFEHTFSLFYFVE